jgi:excisionase family DNA binding protein
MTDQQLLTVEQIASEFQLTSQTIRNWIRSGALSAVKLGHVYRVRREDLDAMMRRHQGETAPLGTHRDLWSPETLRDAVPSPGGSPAAVDLGRNEQLDADAQPHALTRHPPVRAWRPSGAHEPEGRQCGPRA